MLWQKEEKNTTEIFIADFNVSKQRLLFPCKIQKQFVYALFLHPKQFRFFFAPRHFSAGCKKVSRKFRKVLLRNGVAVHWPCPLDTSRVLRANANKDMGLILIGDTIIKFSDVALAQ